MATIAFVNAFKVVNTAKHTLKRGRSTETRTRSALLNRSNALIDYGVTLGKGTQRIFTGPAVAGTPIICFDDAQAALDFAAGRPGNKVYTVEAYAEQVVPVTRVLKLTLGWERNLAAFWKAVREGGDLTGFDTRSAPAHSIAIFGLVGLVQHITEVPVVVEPPAEADALPAVDAAD